MLQKQSTELRGARTAQVFAELNPEAQRLQSVPPSFWAQKTMIDKQSANLYGLGNETHAKDLYYDKNSHSGEVNVNPFAK